MSSEPNHDPDDDPPPENSPTQQMINRVQDRIHNNSEIPSSVEKFREVFAADPVYHRELAAIIGYAGMFNPSVLDEEVVQATGEVIKAYRDRPDLGFDTRVVYSCINIVDLAMDELGPGEVSKVAPLMVDYLDCSESSIASLAEEVVVKWLREEATSDDLEVV
mgnify:CR=1 FL=1